MQNKGQFQKGSSANPNERPKGLKSNGKPYN